MSDTKNVLLVIVVMVVVVLGIVFGLSRMGQSSTSAAVVDQKVLTEGARFVKNNGEIKVTVVSFGDMQCPSCKIAKEQMKSLESMQGVSYIFRHFPLPPNIHKHSLISAKAVEASRVMGRGWEMVELLFEKQSDWSDETRPEKKFAEYAVSLGLDEKKFVETMNSSEVAKLVVLDTSVADSLRLSGTPTVFVNGEQIAAPFVVEKVKELLSK